MTVVQIEKPGNITLATWFAELRSGSIKTTVSRRYFLSLEE